MLKNGCFISASGDHLELYVLLLSAEPSSNSWPRRSSSLTNMTNTGKYGKCCIFRAIKTVFLKNRRVV
jgi:hypothetical protein